MCSSRSALVVHTVWSRTVLCVCGRAPCVLVCWCIRVFDGVESNWLLGFHSGCVQCAHFDAWVTPSSNGEDKLWRTLIASNAAGTQGGLWVDGARLSTSTGGGSGSKTLSINYGYYHSSQPSSSVVGGVVIYDRHLSAAEIQSLYQAFTSGALSPGCSQGPSGAWAVYVQSS